MFNNSITRYMFHLALCSLFDYVCNAMLYCIEMRTNWTPDHVFCTDILSLAIIVCLSGFRRYVSIFFYFILPLFCLNRHAPTNSFQPEVKKPKCVVWNSLASFYESPRCFAETEYVCVQCVYRPNKNNKLWPNKKLIK